VIPELPPVYGACIEALRCENMPVTKEFKKTFAESYRRITC